LRSQQPTQALAYEIVFVLDLLANELVTLQFWQWRRCEVVHFQLQECMYHFGSIIDSYLRNPAENRAKGMKRKMFRNGNYSNQKIK
jgi:hypothetical protein